MHHIYTVDADEFKVELDDDAYQTGKDEILTSRFGDLLEAKSWFNDGYKKEKAEKFYSRDQLYKATENAIKDIICSLDKNLLLDGFTLTKYHEFVNDGLHKEVINKTRRLFPSDLGIDTDAILTKFGNYLNKKLTFHNPVTGKTQWMIARINRPQTNDYNTAHKDIYQVFDEFGVIPKMVNIWIPLSGVTNTNCLPLVPKSHLFSEKQIERTKAGSSINGTHYSVASIKSWNNRSNLQRVFVDENELLIFSSHLIHGLAYNGCHDTTRISFEFRLYEEL